MSVSGTGESAAKFRRPVASVGTVLRAVLDTGPIARSTIARTTGLSPATVTNATAHLLARGLLRELPEVSGPTGLGRPHVPIDLDDRRHVVYGIHLAMFHVTVAALDLRGNVLDRIWLPHHGHGPQQVLPDAVAAIADLDDGADGRRIPIGVGFAAGGWVDSESGVIVDHPITAWSGTAVRAELERLTGLDVRVDSHARALIDAETLYGDRRSRDSVVQLFVGNVVDAAFATDGRVHHGPRAAAGAVAHLTIEGSTEACSCGRTGCFQATLSDAALSRRATELGIVVDEDFSTLLDHAAAGDGAARTLFLRRAYEIGRAAGRLIDVVNPEVLILCDRAVEVVQGYLPEVHRGVRDESSVCREPLNRVVGSSFPGRSLPVSAGSIVLAEVFREPLDTVPCLLARTS